MKHLTELRRTRPLGLYKLTPRGVLPAIGQNVFIVIANYPQLQVNDDFQPLYPKVRSLRTSHKSTPVRRHHRRFYAVKSRKLYEVGCPTCGEEHESIKYFGQRHICNKCKEHIYTTDNRPVHIGIDKQGEIKAHAYEGATHELVDHEDLKIFDKKCYATYTGDSTFSCFLY